MKKFRLPDSNEWDRIVEEAFSSDEEHIFSDKYNEQKRRMTRRITMTKRSDNKKRFTAIIAAAAAAAIVIPSSVFAYSRISAKIEKTANYRATVSVKAPDDVQQLAEGKYWYYELGYLPEGYAWSKEYGKYKNDNGGGMVTSFYVLPEGTDAKINLTFSDNCTEYESDGKKAMISYRVSYEPGTTNYGRDVIVTFADTPCILQLIISDDVTPEELEKFIDNIALIQTDEQMYGDYIPFLDPNNSSGYTNMPVAPELDWDCVDIRTVGDTVSYPYELGFMDGFDFTLNSVEYTDSLLGIETDGSGKYHDYSDIMDENGNIRENIRQYISYGDGVNTLDEILDEEPMPLHILKVNATYANNSDQDTTIVLCPRPFIIEDGVATPSWTLQKEIDGKNCSYLNTLFGRFMPQNHFAFTTDPQYIESKNDLLLHPGDSADVDLYFYVPDDQVDQLYIYFNEKTRSTFNHNLNAGEPAYKIEVN